MAHHRGFIMTFKNMLIHTSQKYISLLYTQCRASRNSID